MEEARKARITGSRCNAFHTAIIIENSQQMWQPAPEKFELDLLSKNRSDVATSVKLSQATWLTWTIEACMEYCRIGWDIVPDYSVSVSACGQSDEPLVIVPVEPLDTVAPALPFPKLKSLRMRFMEIAKVSQKPTNIAESLNAASCANVVDKLRSLENDQLMTAPLRNEDLPQIVAQEPFFIRIVLVTAETNEEKVAQILQKAILDQNLSYLARFEIAVILAGTPSRPDRPDYYKVKGHGDIFVRWYCAPSGTSILDAMKNCITWDLRLSKTVITDIPMKEDAKSGGTTSFSFDVELFHPCLIGENRKMRPGGEILRMKWVKPIRGPIVGYSTMDNTVPIRASASEPTTRPTMCLVGYVVDGNAIFVESKEPAVAGKLYLCSGKICLQQLTAGADRSVDDFPSLNELPGGRVGSYRVKETVSLLSLFPLDTKSFPLKASMFEDHKKMTNYFPLVYNETMVFLLPQLIGLFDVLNVVLAPEENWVAAREAIDEVLEMEKKGASLPAHVLLQNTSSAHRKVEGYAILFAELDMLLECNSVRSARHMKLWTHFKSVIRKPLREDIKTSLRDRVRTHVYQEPLAVAKAAPVDETNPKKRKPRPEFEGRIKWGRYGKLYQNLPKPDKNDGGLIHASLEL